MIKNLSNNVSKDSKIKKDHHSNQKNSNKRVPNEQTPNIGDLKKAEKEINPSKKGEKKEHAKNK